MLKILHSTKGFKGPLYFLGIPLLHQNLIGRQRLIDKQIFSHKNGYFKLFEQCFLFHHILGRGFIFKCLSSPSPVVSWLDKQYRGIALVGSILVTLQVYSLRPRIHQFQNNDNNEQKTKQIKSVKTS